jgi:hypothetical protein
MAGPIWNVIGGIASLAIVKKGVDEVARGFDGGDDDRGDADD